MKTAHCFSLAVAATAVALGSDACAQVSQQTLNAIGVPDKIETRAGTLEFQDGAPTVATAEKVRDTLDFTRALNVYNNSFRGASAYAIGRGFQSIGADDNTIVIFQDLMDAKSLFLTANADTVYFLGVLDLSKGPLVVEQPPGSLGTFNDMWFNWIIDGGFPGPDRGEGGKYLLLPPGYDGSLPDGGFFTARSSPAVLLRRSSLPVSRRVIAESSCAILSASCSSKSAGQARSVNAALIGPIAPMKA